MLGLILGLAMTGPPEHVRTRNFDVYAPDRATALQAAYDAEEARTATLRRWFGREDSPWTFTVQVAVRVRPGVTLGYTWSFLGGIVNCEVAGETPAEAQRYLAHEVAHAVVFHEAPWCPGAIQEGIAVDMEGGYPYRLGEALRGGPLRDALAVPVPTEDWEAHYGRGYSVATHLRETYGTDDFWAFLGEAAAYGVDAAALRVYGTTIDELDAGWAASLTAMGSTYPRTMRGRTR